MRTRRTLGPLVAAVLIGSNFFDTGSIHAHRVFVASASAANAQVEESEPSPSPAAAAGAAQRTVLDRYCITCHNQALKTAGLMLDKLDVERVTEDAETWEKVVRKLRSGAMPPPGAPRPDRATTQAFVSRLETSLDRAAANPNPGRPTVHRLNRAEYANAVRDLLAVEIDARSLLPADDSGYGFDNIADVLSISPALLDRYLSAARKISHLAIGDPTIPSTTERYRVSPLLRQDDRMSEDLPFGTRGGIAIRHRFPVDGEYVVKIGLQRLYGGGPTIRGIEDRNELEVRVDGTRIKLFEIGGKFRDPSERSHSSPGTKEEQKYEETADDRLEVRFSAKAGLRLVGVAFLKRISGAAEGLGPASFPIAQIADAADRHAEMRVEFVRIGGPYNETAVGDTPSRRQIFVCRPTRAAEEEPCAKRILSKLALRAYRQPVTKADLEALLGFYHDGEGESGFETGIEWSLERILMSPYFLFRVERDPVEVAPISDFELASRLSFFLWSSIPDDELLQVAARGILKTTKILEAQVRRMLANNRATALVANFGGQWLQLRNMRAVAPDSRAFPDFDDNLREAFQRETELFLESQLREDRPIPELLSANYTFLNERLARHYRIPNVYGSHFRRVTLPDETRSGLLGQASVLTVTSSPTRTSPVLRGKWVLENLLGAPPPPPPPNVPDLKDRGADGKPASVRERLEQHRKNPVCASCHARMDPLGFALENFDAIGRWRTTSEADTPIDASGALPDGTRFEGAAGLRQVLLARRDEFVNAITEKLLTYALGRGVEYFDAPAVRRITREAAAHDYRWSSVILGIVRSTPFQMRNGRESGTVGTTQARRSPQP